MMAVLNHLEPTVRQEVDWPAEKRIAALRHERYVEHRRLRGVLDEVEFLLEAPRRTRAAGLIVSAPQGSGKTMLAQVIERRHGAKAAPEPGGRRTHRAVGITMTNARDARTLYNRILDRLGAPMTASARYSDRERQLVHLLQQFDTRLLVVDELQDILTSTPRQQRLALDAIKFLMNEAGLPVLALGIAKASEAILVDRHLATRFRALTLPVWTYDDDLRDFLETLEPLIPLRKPSRLSSPTMMKALIDASHGVLLTLCQLIEHAAIYAVVENLERIDPTLIRRAAVEAPAGALRRARSTKV
jgi:hypothetical protein